MSNFSPMSYPQPTVNTMQNPYAMQNPYMSNIGRYNPYQPVNTQNNNGIIWVQGIEGAKAYQLAPNSNAILLDSDTEGRFYIKVSDNVGMCNLRIFNYTEMTDMTQPTISNQNIDMSQYVTKEELKEYLAELGGINNGKQFVSTNDAKSK